MKVLRRIMGALASTAIAGGIIFGIAQPAQAADPWTCSSGSNPGVWDPSLITTPRPPVYIWNRKIELRYHSGTRCAWGRISNGLSGDQVWVDWDDDGGAPPWRQLGVKSIPWGGTQVYTTAHNDRNFVMRACGKAGDRGEIACTNWY